MELRPVGRRPGLPFLVLATTLFLVAGCLPTLKPDVAALSYASTAPQVVPDCAGCHKYPVSDVNHEFHLRTLSSRTGVQSIFQSERKTGQIVCMDCHFGSIAHRAYEWFDTTWGRGGEPVSDEERLPTDTILAVSPGIPGFLPIPSGTDPARVSSDQVDRKLDSAARLGEIVTWLTSQGHLNGKVDVEFSPFFVAGQDTSLHLTAYNPKDLSCSSIACHTAPRKTYRWASEKMGLTGCPTLEHGPLVDSSCRYSPKQEPQ